MPGKSYFLGVSRTFSRCMYMCMCVCLHARQINRKLEGKQSGATHQMFTSDRLSGQGPANCIACLEDFRVCRTDVCSCFVLSAALCI
jgi:hypothetical protein